MKIPRHGSTGRWPVGSGKMSLLQGGELRKTSGSIMFGGSVGYCPGWGPSITLANLQNDYILLFMEVLCLWHELWSKMPRLSFLKKQLVSFLSVV